MIALKLEFKMLISQGSIMEVFSRLIKMLGMNFPNEGFYLKWRFSSLNDRNDKGLLSNDDFFKIKNNLVLSLLNFIDSLKLS